MINMQLYVLCFAGRFITVGWGKKETQFHGSEGKQAAQRKLQVRVQLQRDIFPTNKNVSRMIESKLKDVNMRS